MKKVFIKVLSVLLVVTIFATSLPFSTLAAEENTNDGYNVSTDMGDMSMTATNSFGEMLTESLSEQTNEQNNGYYISDIEYEGYCALVSFVTQQDCTIRVAVYEEDTGRMVTTASANVLATDTEAIVEFEDELPDYFVLKAFMLDENVAPLCKAYTCNEMTKMYEDFMATTTEDFPEDKVINLDEDETNNFLVMSDDTTTVTTDGETNVLLSYDAETGVYTFGNIDEQITTLNVDDIFYFDNGNLEELTFIKVGAIDIDGTIAYITEAETSIEETFDIVKIDNQLTSEGFVIDEDEILEDGIIYEGTEEVVEEPDDEITTYGINDESTITLNHNYTLDSELEAKETAKINNSTSITGSIKIKGSVGFSGTGEFKYYISSEFQEVELTLTPNFTLNFTVEGVGRLEIKLKPLSYAICAGVYLGISPKFIVEVSAKITINAPIEFTIGIGYNNKDGMINKSKHPSFKPEFKMEGELFIGFDLAPNVKIIHDKLAKLTLGSEIGAKLTAVETSALDENHKCTWCTDGDIDFIGNLTGELVFGEKTKLETVLNINFLNIKIHIADFYYSYTYDEFGWGECPYSLSGICGKNLTWTINESTGILTISGTGAMYSYNHNNRPWDKFKDKITKVVISNGVTTIGNYAFYCYTTLKSVTIPDGVKSIGEASFFNCSNLTNIIIPTSVTLIGKQAFALCTKLTNIKIPNGVIGDGAFSFCNFTNVTLGNGVTTIGGSAFFGCDFANIIIPDSVTYIGDGAFSFCYNLNSITIPDSVTTIGDNAFLNCKSLSSINVDINNQYYSNDKYGVLFNKNKTKLIQYPIVNMNYYTIPNSVTTICDCAFYSSGITSIIIPDSVTTIGDNAFAYCDMLTSITIPDTVTLIDERTFYDCDRLTSVTIPDSVTSISDDAFGICDNLADVYYSGTKSQWKKILISVGNEDLYNATIHYNSTGVTYSLRSNQVNFLSFTSTNSTDTDVHTVTAQNTVVNNEYIIFVLKNSADINNFTDEDILYIDQKTAEAEEITFNYVPKTDDECIIYIIGLFSDSDSVKQEQITPELICEHTTTETIEGYAPTCTETGLTNGLKCSKCGEILTTQQEIPALGHDMITDNAVSPDCINTGLTEGSHCSRCDYVVEQTVIDALGHKYESIVTAPTCTEDGYTTYTCSVCDDSFVADVINALGHIEVEIPAVAPTCTETGLTEGTKCSACGETLTEQTTIPANGHTPANTVEENYVAPTCTENGSKDVVVYCSVCEEEISRDTVVINATGHSYTSVVTPPTCTEQGYTTYTCDCGETYVDDYVNATGHADNDGDGYCDTDNELLDPSVECDHNCHKEGFTGILWRIINVFNMLFGLNKTCDCGVAHY